MKKKFFIFLFCIILFLPSISVLAIDIDSSALVTKISDIPKINFNSDGTASLAAAGTGSLTSKPIFFVIPMDELLDSNFYIKFTSASKYYYYRWYGNLYSDEIPVIGGTYKYSVNDSADSSKNYWFNSPTKDEDITERVVKYYDADYKYLVMYILPEPVKSGSSYTYPQANYVNLYQQLNYVPTPLPTASPTPTLAPTASPVPSSVPSPSSPLEDLNDLEWWMAVYELYVEHSHTATLPMTANFVPYDSALFDQEQHNPNSDGVGYVHQQNFTYRVKIPFRFSVNGFDGVGKFDTHIGFDADVSVYLPSDDSIIANYSYSIPWIESVDSTVSFDATAPGSRWPTGITLHNASISGGKSPEYYYCFDVFVNLQSAAMMLNFGTDLKVVLNNLRFDITDSSVESERLPSQILEDINKGVKDTNDTIKEEHQEEIDKADEAVGEVISGVDEITGVLSSWEILTMPVKLVGDFVGAISSDGSTGITFPSFTLMGQQLWPSYTFDLAVIAEKFPALYNALHVISGILVVIAFLRYCWRKWSVLTGDDLPEGESK